jgi:hypothetical protein
MERNFSGKNILIVEGSLLAGAELAEAFGRSGAGVQLTANIINAFDLLRRTQFDGAVIDQGLHNEAFDLCSELRELGIPFICCAAPHRLQSVDIREREARHAVWRLDSVISQEADAPSNSIRWGGLLRNERSTLGA